MTEIQIAERTYRIGRMNPRTALHVARRIAPVVLGLAELAPLMERMTPLLRVTEGETPPSVSIAEMVEMARPMSLAVAEMPEADFDYLVDHCLAVVHVRRGGDTGWAPLMVNGSLMFEDLTPIEMGRLVWEVIQENLRNFFPAGALTS
jgi:hypothetical protein